MLVSCITLMTIAPATTPHQTAVMGIVMGIVMGTVIATHTTITAATKRR